MSRCFACNLIKRYLNDLIFKHADCKPPSANMTRAERINEDHEHEHDDDDDELEQGNKMVLNY